MRSSRSSPLPRWVGSQSSATGKGVVHGQTVEQALDPTGVGGDKGRRSSRSSPLPWWLGTRADGRAGARAYRNALSSGMGQGTCAGIAKKKGGDGHVSLLNSRSLASVPSFRSCPSFRSWFKCYLGILRCVY